MEVNSTDGFLAEIVKINEENSSPQGEEYEEPNKTYINKTIETPDVDKTIEIPDVENIHEGRKYVGDGINEEAAFYITDDGVQKTLHTTAKEKNQESGSSHQEGEQKRESKTKLIRRKMMEARMPVELTGVQAVAAGAGWLAEVNKATKKV